VDSHGNDPFGCDEGTNPSGHAVRFHAGTSALSDVLYFSLKFFSEIADDGSIGFYWLVAANPAAEEVN